MQLILENFRQHKHLDLTIPETGLIKLHGPSGIGKTTIFDAILEALYGEADDVTPWGESKASVTLRTGDVEIVRTRGPVSLKVTAGSMTLRDEAAQAQIDRIMGMGAQEFLASSYIRSGFEGSILSLPPADQLRFVQELAVGAYDPETFKEKLAEYLKVKTITLSKVEGEIASKIGSISAQSAQIEKKLAQLPPEPSKPDLDFDAAAHESNKAVRDGIAKKLKELKALQTSPFYGLAEKVAHAREHYLATTTANLHKIKELTADLAELSAPVDDTTLLQAREKITLKQRFLEGKARLMKEIQAFWAAFPEFKDAKISTVLPEEIKKLTVKIDESLSKALDLAGEIDSLYKSKTALACPSCDAKLNYINNTLSHFNCEAFDEVKYNTLTAKLKSDQDERLNWTERRNEFVSVLKTCDRLKAEMGTDPDPKMNLVEAMSAVNGMLEVRQLSSDWLKEIAQLQGANDRERMAVERLEEQLKTYKDMPTKAELAKAIETNENGLNECMNDISTGELIKGQWALYHSGMQNRENVKKMIQSDKDRLEADQRELASLEQLKFNLNLKIAATKKNKELADFASISACDLILENINEHAREYLDKFFPEDGTSVVLKNTTVTKTGNERAKLSLGVYHKGKEAKKLGSLSHGEKSRVYLAFQLALSEMYNSPMLLIDEGFSGLPPEHKAECIEFLKEFSETRLVFIIEHGVNEAHFHDVITLT